MLASMGNSSLIAPPPPPPADCRPVAGHRVKIDTHRQKIDTIHRVRIDTEHRLNMDTRHSLRIGTLHVINEQRTAIMFTLMLEAGYEQRTSELHTGP